MSADIESLLASLTQVAAGWALPLQAFGLVVAALGLSIGLGLMGSRRRRRARKAVAEREARLLETARQSAASNEAGLAELRGRLAAIAELTSARQAEFSASLNQRLDQVSDRLSGTLDAVSERLGNGLGNSLADASRRTADTLNQLGERLAVLDRAQSSFTELSGQVVGLRVILSDKQARGAFGQGRMEAIIEDGLPRGTYDFQASLSNGKRPDCLVRLPSSPAPLVIDAKFPLEGFEALRLAANAEAAQAAAASVKVAVGRHIDDIAEKYLIPGETQDMALMFVPAESIYADINEHFPELVQAAHRARVLIVSPNMLMLAVQTMLAILKDVRMREQAGLIQREVGLLMGDVVRLAERVRDLERHFTLGAKDVEKVLASVERITARGRRIEGVDLAEAAAPAPRPLAVAG